MLPSVRSALPIALVVLVAGCGNVAAPDPSASAAATNSEADAYCEGADLLTPNGDVLDLSGTWFGTDDQNYYSFVQAGRCVRAISTVGPNVADQVATDEVLILLGTLASDFTMAVEFAYIPIDCPPDQPPCHGEVGTATLKVDIENGADGDVITLRKVGGATAADRAPNLGVTSWTRVLGDTPTE